tara:strand:- start:1268 stop:2380 length:1113 start_codon:yes stop_codon:yes gene_type:complete
MSVPGQVAEKKTGRSTYTRTRAGSKSQGQKDLPRDFSVNVLPFMIPVGIGVGLIGKVGTAGARKILGKKVFDKLNPFTKSPELRRQVMQGDRYIDTKSGRIMSNKDALKKLKSKNITQGTLKQGTNLYIQEQISQKLDKALPKSAPGEKVGTDNRKAGSQLGKEAGAKGVGEAGAKVKDKDKRKAGSEVGPKAASESKGKATVTPMQKSRQATIDKPVPKPKPKPNRSVSSQDEMGGGSSAPKPKPRPKGSTKERMGDMKAPANKAGSELSKEAGTKEKSKATYQPRKGKKKSKSNVKDSDRLGIKLARMLGDKRSGSQMVKDRIESEKLEEEMNLYRGGMAFGKGGTYKTPKKTYGMRNGGFTRRGASR